MKKRVAASQEWRCAKCTKILPPTFQVDHVFPHSLGGTDHPCNLEALCVECHAAKSQIEQARTRTGEFVTPAFYLCSNGRPGT